MTIYNHNQICTSDNNIEIGKTYTYKESFLLLDVKVLNDTSNNEELDFDLEVIHNYGHCYGKFEVGYTFSIMAALGDYAYSGMWRLYDINVYGKPEHTKKAGE